MIGMRKNYGRENVGKTTRIRKIWASIYCKLVYILDGDRFKGK